MFNAPMVIRRVVSSQILRSYTYVHVLHFILHAYVALYMWFDAMYILCLLYACAHACDVPVSLKL